MNVAVVLQTPRDAHSAVFIGYQRIAAELAARGHKASILTPDDFDATGRVGGRFTPLVYPFLVERWARRYAGDHDAFVFHSYAGWRALSCGATGDAATIVAFHGLEPLYPRDLVEEARRTSGLSRRYRFLQESLMPRFLRTSCGQAGLVVCFNQAERDFIVDAGWTAREHVAVLGHGTPDSSFIEPRTSRAARTVVFVGQWLPMKGTRYLVAAADRLQREGFDLRMVCAGTLAGPDAVLADFTPAAREKVTVLPRVDAPALLELYREADIFVYPSLYEGFGLAILEAMAARLPIVTTRVGVAADALADGVSCLFVPKRDAGALASAVATLVGSQSLRTALGDAAQVVAKGYRQSSRAAQYVDAILGVVGRSAS
jgi:glycosyltransferase involved in cell wall biosynthesis